MIARLTRIVATLKAQRRAERGDDALSIHFDAPSYRVGDGQGSTAELIDLQCRDCPNVYDPELPARGGFHVWGNEGSYWLCDDHEPERSVWLESGVLPREDDSHFRPAHQTDVFLQCEHCGYVFNEMDLRWWYYHSSGQFCDSCKRGHDD